MGNDMNVPTQLAQSSDENSTESVLNTHKRSPIGTVHTNPERIDIVKELRMFHHDKAADEIERLRDKVQDLRMHAQQDAVEMERLFDANRRLRATGDAMHSWLLVNATTAQQSQHLEKVLTAWEETRRG